MAYAYRQMGLNEDADRFLTEFDQIASERHVAPGAKVVASLARGDDEQALQYLEALVSESAGGEWLMGQVKANDLSDPVLEEPRWQEIRDRLGAL